MHGLRAGVQKRMTTKRFIIEITDMSDMFMPDKNEIHGLLLSSFNQCLVNVFEQEQVYKIWDRKDTGYESWYGTEQSIIDYLEEQKDFIHGYNKEDGWVENLYRYGLEFKVIEVHR